MSCDARFKRETSTYCHVQSSRVRPSGITILVVLEAIVSVFLVLAGLLFAALIPVIREIPGTIPSSVPGAILAFVGIVMSLIGFVGFLVAWGLWTGQGWAWTLAFALAVLGVITGIFSLPGGLLAILLDGLIAYYLWQPHVKAFFGKQAVELPYQVTVTRTPTQPAQAQPQPGTVVYCTKCGTPNPLDSRFCRNCGSEIRSQAA